MKQHARLIIVLLTTLLSAQAYSQSLSAVTTQPESQAQCESQMTEKAGAKANTESDDKASACADSVAPVMLDKQPKAIDLKAHLSEGKWTVVEIWSSDCHQCNLHMPSMVAFDGKLDNLNIVGITLDGIDAENGEAKAKAFIERYGVRFNNILSNPIAVNEWMKASIDEGLIGTPTFMILNPKGEFVAAQAGVLAVDKLEQYIRRKSAS